VALAILMRPSLRNNLTEEKSPYPRRLNPKAYGVGMKRLRNNTKESRRDGLNLAQDVVQDAVLDAVLGILQTLCSPEGTAEKPPKMRSQPIQPAPSG
jgi:hypothetical protein